MSQFSNNSNACFEDFLICTVKLSSRKVVPVHNRTRIFDLGSQHSKETGRMSLNGEK